METEHPSLERNINFFFIVTYTLTPKHPELNVNFYVSDICLTPNLYIILSGLCHAQNCVTFELHTPILC